MKHLDSGQFEVNLPFNGKLSLLPSNRELSVARTYKQIRDMANNEKYRTLVVKAKTELEVNDYIERITDDVEPGKKSTLFSLAWHYERGISDNKVKNCHGCQCKNLSIGC